MEESVKLPNEFLLQMKEQLGTEYEAFVASYQESKTYGLRRNSLKIEKENFEQDMEAFGIRSIPWAENGYYYDPETHPGKHPFHEAGMYYIQDPSAMSVAELLAVRPGDIVCDLCAAPGGKTTQIAGDLQGKGMLISNEIHPARAAILSQNVERMGIRNCVVLNETPERLSVFFPVFFDKIVVDAPCSGEGMFRKDENARLEWSPEQVQICADRQDKILEQAARMLKPGGILVYSTCTFNITEDEGTISRFLDKNPDFELQTEKRLWPHLVEGEGHFAARLVRKGTLLHHELEAENDGLADDNTLRKVDRKRSKKTEQRQDVAAECRKFVSENLADNIWQTKLSGDIISFGDQLYLLPKQMLSLQGLKVVRPGLHLGTNKKNRFEPSHALALALCPQDVKRAAAISEKQGISYIHGDLIELGNGENTISDGWCLVCIQGTAAKSYSLAWGKALGGRIKNHYPKGLRK
ncbi:MAG: RsmF rRNA methyltransferase first C-terminal domain-containing protein [Lachnospiraceae bacterium]|nr:RsmF rRNA methyltransferase first C-terminal domain-containing protein [Lachnospiraceae bacterium]